MPAGDAALALAVTALTVDIADDHVPVWSPDGSRIAFQSVRGDNYDVEVVQADGRHRARLSVAAQYDGAHSWSTDGTLLAFLSGRDGYEAVYVMQADGGQPRRLTTQASLDPRWSP